MHNDTFLKTSQATEQSSKKLRRLLAFYRSRIFANLSYTIAENKLTV